MYLKMGNLNKNLNVNARKSELNAPKSGLKSLSDLE